MKTSLQELIKWGDDMLLKYPQKILGFGEVIDKAEELLEKEKEQINKAYYQGIYDKNEGLIKEEYYNQTFNEK
jgi:hypothetical protein